MSDRIIRSNILTSDPVNCLSWAGEVFYRRLMSVVDDFGRYDARPSILRANLYALKIGKVSESDIVKWMNECSEAGLVRFYEVDFKQYLELLKFNQRLRQKKSKYPPPADGCCQLSADGGQLSDEEKQKRRETEEETETEVEPPTIDLSVGLKKDRMFFEQVAQSWGISHKSFEKMIDDFKVILSVNDKVHTDKAEFKSHFFNWGAKKFQNYVSKKKEMVD